jgi:alcohol-forming fatty acyl-CoA reductase
LSQSETQSGLAERTNGQGTGASSAAAYAAPNGFPAGAGDGLASPTYWRVEGSLLDLNSLRAITYLAWNAQSFAQRWTRHAATLFLSLVRPPLYAVNRAFSTRVLHTLLAGISRDRLDLLGEEYFEYVLKPELRPAGVGQLRNYLEQHGDVVLVSQTLDHIMRPLAQHLGVARIISNRLEFRDGVATGRLLDPIVLPRGPSAVFGGRKPDGRWDAARVARGLRTKSTATRTISTEKLTQAIRPAARPAPTNHLPVVLFGREKSGQPLSVRHALAGKNILLIGVTGFIGKVWLEHLLDNLPEVGKISLLIRRQRSTTSEQRFEKMAEESPVFAPLAEKLGDGFEQFLRDHVEVIEGDVAQPGLGLAPEVRERLVRTLDLVVNSSGLTDFNPDLREALSSNVEAVTYLIEFVRETDHAAMMHLSTCYAVGARDGRVTEELIPDYTPERLKDFNAEQEWQQLRELVRNTENRSESPELRAALERQVLGRRRQTPLPPGAELETQIRKNRARWLRNKLTRAGMRRARYLGWPNTYTFTKSLAESLIARRGAGLPIAVVRPSIVETSTDEPFPGWNEGINTSAPLSYLLGTYFRQLPTNARKCLDIIPVDMVCHGMTLIAAALVERRHAPLYQLATSAANPCDMGRSIELTGLAHRKHYRAQQGLEHWLRLRFETIPVSKNRYQKLSVPAQKAVVKGINRAASALQFKKPPLARQERDLARVEKLIELYEPFILHNEQVFECQNVELLSAELPESERAVFGYEPRSVDWWEYWIQIHVPALRKWVYPLIEGRTPEPTPRRNFRLGGASDTGAAPPAALSGPASNATWPSS